MPIDFAAVRANALADGIPVSEIAVIYQNLTFEERKHLREAGLIAYESEGTVIARLSENGHDFFAEKAEGVHSLSA